MLVKQIQFKGLSETGEVFCQPLLGGLEKTAAAEDMRSKLHPAVRDFVGAVREGRAPRVDGAQARRALARAQRRHDQMTPG